MTRNRWRTWLQRAMIPAWFAAFLLYFPALTTDTWILDFLFLTVVLACYFLFMSLDDPWWDR